MTEMNEWIDLPPETHRQASAQLTQSDRAVVGVVSGTHESDPVSIPEGWVEVTIPDSTEPPVVVPSDGGITGLNASVLCGRDSSGRIVSAATPQSLPAGAKPVAVGVTGEWLASLDSLTATLSNAQKDLDAAQAQLVEHLSEVGINAHSSVITEELWARLAVFAKVTTQMLIAGDATITGEMIVNELIGKVLRGGLFEAGGGSLPMVRIGPLSGQVGVGDTYGVQITTPNNSANGRALLAVAPTGPFMEFYNGAGTLVLAADKTGVRVINQTSGGMVDISRLAANTSSWSTNDPAFKVQFATSPSGASPWSSAAFFRKQWAGIDIGAVTTVNTPTGRLMMQSGVYIDSPTTVPSASQPGISVQWGIYDQDPTGRAWDQWANNLVGASGRAECNHLIGGMGSRTNGAEIVNLTPNRTYWVAPIYWTANMGVAITRRIFNLWVSCYPIT